MSDESPATAPSDPPFGSSVHAPLPGWPLPPPEVVSPGERSAAMWAHVGPLIGAVLGLLLFSWIVPLLIRTSVGARSVFARWHATQSLNFELTTVLVAVASLFLSLILVGFVTAIGWAVLYIVTRVKAALAARRGEPFTYPLTIRFVR